MQVNTSECCHDYTLSIHEHRLTETLAVLVGAYKTFQATGGAMAWRINALKVAPMSQLAMNWGLSMGALLIVLPTVWTVSVTTLVSEPEVIEPVQKESE